MLTVSVIIGWFLISITISYFIKKRKKHVKSDLNTLSNIILILMLISVIIVNTSIFDKKEVEKVDNNEQKNDIIIEKQTVKVIDTIGIKNEMKEFEKNIKRLEKKFAIKDDAFKGVGFYKHKRWGNHFQKRKTLMADVNSNGDVWWYSNYFGSDWLFHTSVSVLIDNEVYNSPVVNVYDDNYIQENNSDGVYEMIEYDDLDILAAIKNNVDKTIKVRFNGEKYYSDVVLSNADKQALADCYNLGFWLKSYNNYKKIYGY